MPHHVEPSANNALGNLLQGMLGKGEVRSENTGIITGHSGLKPDILVTAPDRSPVVVEAEYLPARAIECVVRGLLGLGEDAVASVARLRTLLAGDPSIHGSKRPELSS